MEEQKLDQLKMSSNSMKQTGSQSIALQVLAGPRQNHSARLGLNGLLTWGLKRTTNRTNPYDLRMEIGLATTSAKTKPGEDASTGCKTFTDFCSCKHFCCREGLEKPPKPGKKRVVPNAKAAGLSQLTLAASINKQPASASTPSTTQVAKAKAPTKRQNSDLSTAGTTKGQAKRTANQSLFGSAPIKKPNIPQLETETSKAFVPKTPSSDFGDDDVDELPSPSSLFRRTKPSLAFSKSPLVALSRSIEPDPVCVDPSKLSIEQTSDASPAAAPPATQIPQPSGTSKVHRDFGIWDDLSDYSGDEIFTNPGRASSSAITGPFAPSTANTTRDAKRRADVLDKEFDKENHSPLHEYATRDTFQESIAAAVSESTSRNREDQSAMAADDDDTSRGWEDPDRALLEEFKHIINFY